METRIFKDNWHGGWRAFTLSDDRVVIRVTSSGFITRDVTFFMKDLKPRYDSGWKRSSLVFLGGLVFLCGAGWLYGLRGLSNERSLAVGFTITGLGLLFLALGARKRSFATFYLQTGATAFDILAPRFSGDTVFRSFVDEIVRRIPEERKEPNSGSSAP